MGTGRRIRRTILPARGDTLVLFGTGEGQTDPPGVTGQPAGDVLPKPVAQIMATIGGVDAEVVDVSAVPMAAGRVQITVRVPDDAGSGAQPAVVSIGSISSQQDLTVSIQ